MYVIGRALTILLPAWLDASYLADEIAALPSFANGSADIILALFCRSPWGLALRHHNVISRFTLWMCRLRRSLCIRGSYAHLAAAGATVALMLLRWADAGCIWDFRFCFPPRSCYVYSDGAWQNIYGYVFEKKYRRHIPPQTEFFVGGLTVPSSWFGGGEPLPQGANFYLGLFVHCGNIGYRHICRVPYADGAGGGVHGVAYRFHRRVHGEPRRFGAIRSAADTRLGVLSPPAAAVTVLFCAAHSRIFGKTTQCSCFCGL